MSPPTDRYKFTVNEFVRMEELGFFQANERVELLNGMVVVKSTPSVRHAKAVTALSSVFAELAQRRYLTSPLNPIELEKHSAPRPDICLLAHSARTSRWHPSPEDAHLVVEVSDTSLEYDRGPKLTAYAQCGIRELWILNLQEDVLEIYRNHEQGAYLEQLIVPATGSAAPQTFPDVVISLLEIIPDR